MSEVPRSEHFRAGVGLVVINEQGFVLACERGSPTGAWQLPQGGLERDEEPLQAALRELSEETGLPASSVELIAEFPTWLAYELPLEFRKKPWRGQVQRFFLFRLLGNEDSIRLDAADRPEFRDWRWMTLGELTNRVIWFRKPTYRRLAEQFAPYLAL